MKQSLFSQKLVDLFSKLDINQSYVLDGFHLDFFLSLYSAIDIPTFILLPDDLFGVALKYLSVLKEDRMVAFVPPEDRGGGGPVGFVRENSFQARRTAELLSSGLSSVSFVVCAESGLSIPMVGADPSDKLDFSSIVSFDDCLSFFSTHNYGCVDVVVDPGEFCVRGGIVDVYPFSSTGPVRLSFLNEAVDVQRFDAQSQLTTGAVNNFSIVSTQKRGLLPLKDCCLSGFLSLYYGSNGDVDTKAIPVGFSKTFTYISFLEFVGRGAINLNNVQVDSALSSIGVVDGDDGYIVPCWFVSAAPVVSDSPPKRGVNNYSSLSITNIKKGDYLVHRDHGVGICMGLHVYGAGAGAIQEFLSIKYEDGGIIRLDTSRLDLVDYYAAADAENVCVDSLHKRASWSRRRRAAHRQAEETIEYLLNMYVRRNDASRLPFISNNEMERQFLDDFPHEDTDDQASAWQEISDDLSSLVPMDRLLCGDVGFGKTEIAMRAAFRVVLGGKRVLVLAPTTILANQLYTSFCARLGEYAVNVEVVSRFRSAKNISVVREKILIKENDILVGTHSVLNDDIYLNNIGLLIVDEEHRFGVRQKEKIKCFKEGVDVLSMSATPIPRSLNMALVGIYSISLLQTPPLMRLSIITHVDYFSDSLICGAVSFEVGRGGQVYFVHNNIQSIKHITERLIGLLPDLKIIFIHGQESPKDIEKKMNLFVSGGADVLVCTSIIEAGIDVPNVNCIIINNSHLFGLSQLYQIRGRVGRGHRQAYAYLLIPVGLSLSNGAFDRLKTIEKNVCLGSGYNISRSDMVLRGSGSVFGYKQSGSGGAVGYKLYLRLVQRALHESGGLKTKFVVLPEDVLIKIYKQRHIPEDYIALEGLRLSFYKSFTSAVDAEEVDKTLFHLINRFGPPPPPVNNLVHECHLRLLAATAGFRSIEVRGCGIVCKIIQNNNKEFISAVLEYIENYWGGRGVDFHLLPLPGPCLSVCLHISHKTDKYSLLSSFLDKFKAVV